MATSKTKKKLVRRTMAKPGRSKKRNTRNNIISGAAKMPSLKFNRRTAILFILVFGLIGAYILFRTFAATPVLTVEAEQMTLPDINMKKADSVASDGYSVFFGTNATISTSVQLPNPAASITIRAKGISCQGAPTMVVTLDGVAQTPISVSSTSWNDYTIPKPLIAGSHNIDIAFTNDYNLTHRQARKSCSRDLYVDKITFFGQDPSSTSEVARNKPATASSVSADGYGRTLQPQYANDGSNTVTSDGNTPSRWSSVSADNQWWQVDLGAITSINKVDVNWEVAYASHYKIQGSIDGTNFTDLADVTLTSAGLKSSSFNAASARYVRIFGLTRGTQWGFSIWEVQVYSSAPSSSLTATMKTPINGSTVSTPIPVEATASGPNGVTSVEFWLDGTLRRTENVAPYCMEQDGGAGTSCYTWDPATVPNGTHTITAYAIDSTGAKSPPSTVTFSVNNVAPTPTPGWVLKFEDNFDGAAGSSPDSLKWSLYNSPGHAGNGLRRPSQCKVDGSGLLVLTGEAKVDPADGVLKTWSCGMSGKFSTTYGAFETRVRTEVDPSGTMSGLTMTWPEGSQDNCKYGELDFYETGTGTNTRTPFYSYLHYPNCIPGSRVQKQVVHQADGSQWHVMRMEWEPSTIRIYRDGALISTLNEDPSSDIYVPDVAHHPTIQLDAFNTRALPSPVREYVDYYRIYTKQ
jgi:hypothetical protein